MFDRRRFLAATGAGLAGSMFSGSLYAQIVGKTARIISGFPAGGMGDAVSRPMAEKLRGAYAPVVITESKTGAGGRIAVEFVKNAEADRCDDPADPGLDHDGVPAHLQETRLRRIARLCARHDDLYLHLFADRGTRASAGSENRSGARPVAQSESEAGEFRVAIRGIIVTLYGRDVRAGRRGRTHACCVQRRCAAVARCNGRRDPNQS